jgi:hypothetical protein
MSGFGARASDDLGTDEEIIPKISSHKKFERKLSCFESAKSALENPGH